MESSFDERRDVPPADSIQNSVENVLQDADQTHCGQQGTSESSSVGKTPRKVLHFSDGVLEEYSTDEEQEEVKETNTSKAVDTKRLTWPQYVLYATMAFGNGTLKVCDYLGEGLASFFGITTPKYQYEINEYERMVKEQEEAKKKEDVEMRGWRGNEGGDAPAVVSAGPAPAVSTESETQERY